MKFTVKMFPQAVNKIKQAQVDALKLTASKMYAEKVEQQQIPFAEGTLQNVSTDVDDTSATKGQVQITSEGAYASKLYFNPQFNFNHEFNTNAKGEWWEDYLSGANSKRPQELYKHYFNKTSGGYVK